MALWLAPPGACTCQQCQCMCPCHRVHPTPHTTPHTTLQPQPDLTSPAALPNPLQGFASPTASPALLRLLHSILHDSPHLTHPQVLQLLSARGADMQAVCTAAGELRQRTCGDAVTYVVNRNINYTNVCTYGCTFCAFSKGKAAEELRGAPYVVPLEEISRRAAEAWDRGATEVCMQGGIHPDFTGGGCGLLGGKSCEL